MPRNKFAVKALFSSKLFILAVLVLAILLGLALGRSFLKRYQVNQEIETLKTEIAKLETGNRDLNDLISYLQTDFFAEQEARLKLGLQKPGEKVVIIPSNEADIKPALAISEEGEYNEKALSNPRKWWLYFFGASGQ
ncbi:MAG: septum formation initiator family protein [bacterium]